MAESNGGGGIGGSNRNASNARPKVQQLRPTNKDVPAATTTTSAPIAIAAPPNRPSVSRTESSESATKSASTAKVIPRIVTGQGSGSTIVVNNCQVRTRNA